MYDCRVHLVIDQRVRIMKLLIAAYSADDSAAVEAWVMLELTDTDRTRVQSGGRAEQRAGRLSSRWEKSQLSIAEC